MWNIFLDFLWIYAFTTISLFVNQLAQEDSDHEYNTVNNKIPNQPMQGTGKTQSSKNAATTASAIIDPPS